MLGDSLYDIRRLNNPGSADAVSPSLPDDASLRQIFPKFPATSAPLLDYHEVLLRGPSPLSVAERELIAAYVSSLNACGYCHGIHARTAAEFGVEESLLAALWRTQRRPQFQIVSVRS